MVERVLSFLKDKLIPLKVIASKSCVLLRYMKVRHQLIFITGVRLGSFLTIN